MISFRYHLVSIVAVFLALALGVVVGTTVVNQGIIDDLNNRTDAAAKNAANLRQQVVDLQRQLAASGAFENSVLPLLVKDKLAGEEVVLVTQTEVDPSEVEGVRRVLEDAGASVTGEVVVTNRMALSDDRSRSDMASALQTVDSAIPEQLAQEAANAVAARLADGPAPDGQEDLLDALDAAGFIVIRGGAAGTEGIGGPNQAMILLAGTERDPALDPQLFLMPLANALVQEQRHVAAAETEGTVAPFVLPLRESDVDGRLVTVDNADQMSGRVALVWGLGDLIASPGSGGDYGVKAGASSLVPRSEP